jgi:hypothetical protein
MFGSGQGSIGFERLSTMQRGRESCRVCGLGRSVDKVFAMVIVNDSI